MTDTGTPLCKNCHHIGVRMRDGLLCCRPVGTGFSPVTGPQTYKQAVPCVAERARDRSMILRRAMCGPQGRFFEQNHRGPPPSCRGR